MGKVVLILLIAALVIYKWVLPQMRAKARREYLIKKYGEEDGRRLFTNTIWEGMTEEMVLDLLGKPGEIKHGLAKGKSTQSWRYFDGNRRVTRHRIMFEDGVVTGWAVKEQVQD